MKTWTKVLGPLACLAVLMAPIVARADSYRYEERRGAAGYEHRQANDEFAFKYRPHLYLGGRALALLVVGQDTDYRRGYLDNGAGAGAFIGIRIAPPVALEFNWTTTWHHDDFVIQDVPRPLVLDSVYMMSFTGDLKLHIPAASLVDPYFIVGAGYAFVGADSDVFDLDRVFSEGPTFQIGGGLDIWLGPYLTVGGKIYYRGVYLEEPKADIRPSFSNYVSAITFDVSLGFHF